MLQDVLSYSLRVAIASAILTSFCTSRKRVIAGVGLGTGAYFGLPYAFQVVLDWLYGIYGSALDVLGSAIGWIADAIDSVLGTNLSGAVASLIENAKELAPLLLAVLIIAAIFSRLFK